MKKLLVTAILFLPLLANIFSVDISVESNKSSGKSWDLFGGAPDIWISVDGEKLPFLKRCKNSYRCKIVFESNKTKWYFEIYDKDLKESDLIGKGECSINQKCTLDRAKIVISSKSKEQK